MAVPHDGEIGNGVQLKEVWTRDHEKVTRHEISCPGGLEERKAIKNIEDLSSFGSGNAVYLGCEGFKTGVCIQRIYLYMFRRLKERIMVGEPHVDDPPLFLDGI